MNWSYAEIAGTIGACLGVLNLLWAWWVWWKNHQLNVKVKWHESEDANHLFVDVSNLSHFDVTVTEVGFVNRDGRRLEASIVIAYVNEQVLPKRILARGYASFKVINESVPLTTKSTELSLFETAYIKLTGDKYIYSNI
jgi:hypothetical protein